MVQKCGQLEKAKRARVTEMLNGHQGIQDREVYSVTERSAAQRTKIIFIHVKVIEKWDLLNNKLDLICS